MPWVESASPSFRARHEAAHTEDASRVLRQLERTRDDLMALFPRPVADLTIVLHGSELALGLANPLVPLAWLVTAPSARRYVAGWAGARELDTLAPAVLRARASAIRGSREMLALTPAALYARRVVIENNPQLAGARTPARIARELRWAWLVEGSARWFAGQTDHARAAIARRLHEGAQPSFPPALADAPLLGGTVIDLLAREEGELAAARLACRLHPRWRASCAGRGVRRALAGVHRGSLAIASRAAGRRRMSRRAAGRRSLIPFGQGRPRALRLPAPRSTQRSGRKPDQQRRRSPARSASRRATGRGRQARRRRRG